MKESGITSYYHITVEQGSLDSTAKPDLQNSAELCSASKLGISYLRHTALYNGGTLIKSGCLMARDTAATVPSCTWAAASCIKSGTETIIRVIQHWP